MSFKTALVICFSAFFVQIIAGQCIGAPMAYGAPLALERGCGPLNAGPLAVDWAGITATTGGGLVVTSASPIAPVGVSVVSDNAFEGAVAVGGALPYLGAVAIEAAVPTAGAGTVAYGCGNGAVAITAEETAPIGFAGVAGPTGFVPGITGPIGAGLGPIGLAPGCGGCGAVL